MAERPSTAELTVTPLKRDDPAFVRFLEYLSTHPELWDDITVNDVEGYIEYLFGSGRTSFFNLGPDLGVVYFTDIMPGVSARLHVCTWSRSVAGRYDLAREAIREAMTAFDLHRVYAVVPGWLKTLEASVRRLGMVYEGAMRESMRYEGKWYDGLVYSLLRHEVEQDAPEPRWTSVHR